MRSGNVNAQVVDFLVDLESVTTKAVAGSGAVAYTYSYPMQLGTSYAFEYQFESGGVINCQLELEHASSLPATEGAASAWFVVPEDAAVFDAACVDANRHIKAYSPAAMPFARLKVTGLVGNAATTKLNVARMSIIRGS